VVAHVWLKTHSVIHTGSWTISSEALKPQDPNDSRKRWPTD